MVVSDGLGKARLFLKALSLFFILSFLRCLLSHFCDPGTVLDTEDIVLNCSSVTSTITISNLGLQSLDCEFLRLLLL